MTATPFIIGVVGDSGSGKNTLADALTLLFGPERVTDLRLDDYHRFTREERALRGLTALNPIVHNLPLIQEHLQLLREGRPIRNRSYNHADGSFGPIRPIVPGELVLVRGLLGFTSEEIRALYHLTVFLQPEPELLFRWKLRRDVLSRGYSEADVLKSIAKHLLDSKEFVLPQAAVADVLVRHELAEWDAPDTEVQTTLNLRGEAAETARNALVLDALPAEVGEGEGDEAGEIVVRFPIHLPEQEVDGWIRERLPERYLPERVGVYLDENGVARRRPQLALVEAVITRLVEAMRSRVA